MDVIDNSTVKVAQLERVLAEVDSGVKSAYQGGNIDDANRGLAEKQLLIRGEIPEVLVPVVERLLTTTLNSLREEIDSSVLYFSDYRWLGLSDDKATYDFQAAHTIDSLRKVALPRDARLRRCARCCAYMEDVTPTKGTSMWVANLQKTCHCGSLWMLVGPRQ
ncbi:MAG: mediator complex subunit [Thelocarpon impressellum]|nr:MAG: mediator complex subunit [Thelocarpon impressellum]